MSTVSFLTWLANRWRVCMMAVVNTTQTAAFCTFLATLSPAQQRALCSITTKFECDAVEAANARPVVDGVDVLSLVGDVNRAMIESIFALPPRR